MIMKMENAKTTLNPETDNQKKTCRTVPDGGKILH